MRLILYRYSEQAEAPEEAGRLWVEDGALKTQGALADDIADAIASGEITVFPEGEEETPEYTDAFLQVLSDHLLASSYVSASIEP